MSFANYNESLSFPRSSLLIRALLAYIVTDCTYADGFEMGLKELVKFFRSVRTLFMKLLMLWLGSWCGLIYIDLK